ncbi:uncharacterized protein [Amphiura filiformis]|uniref:uncharacterized protein n=1 Tax=Amphiura filiformis TaxID=82378 RepID=UPI003B225571
MAATTASLYGPDGLLCDRKLTTISNLIGNKYPDLGFKLGLTAEQIRAAKSSSPERLEHQVYYMLATWKDEFKQDATMDRLNQALQDLGWISVLTQIRNTPEHFYVVL